MPVDMKEIIARAALTLLTERKARKLTVKLPDKPFTIISKTFRTSSAGCWSREYKKPGKKPLR